MQHPLLQPDTNPLERTAHLLSLLLHPFFIPLYAVGLLLFAPTIYALLPLSTRLYLVGVVALYTLLLPALSLVLLRRRGWLSSYRIDQRRERILPLMIGTVCYLLCALTLLKVPVAQLLHRMMFGAALCQGLCLVVTLRWKISLHLTGLGGATSFFVLLSVAGAGDLLLPMVGVVLCSGLLSSARLYLGCHNGWQILAGYAGGFLMMSLAMLFV